MIYCIVNHRKYADEGLHYFFYNLKNRIGFNYTRFQTAYVRLLSTRVWHCYFSSSHHVAHLSCGILLLCNIDLRLGIMWAYRKVLIRFSKPFIEVSYQTMIYSLDRLWHALLSCSSITISLSTLHRLSLI